MRIIILGAGLAGVGKSTHLTRLAETLTGQGITCVYLDKDKINADLGQVYDPNSEYYKNYVKPRSYQLMIESAQRHITDGTQVVILDGYFGDKLTASPTKELLIATEFDTRVIYFHCTGETQRQRLTQRGLERDADKEGEKFKPYRRNHLQNHMRELAQIPPLFIDTEREEDLESNIASVVTYLERPSESQRHFKCIPCVLTEETAMQGAPEFQIILSRHTQLVQASAEEQEDPLPILATSTAMFEESSNPSSASTQLTNPKLDLSGFSGVTIGQAVQALTPRTHSRAIVEATAKVGMFGIKYNTDAPGRKSIHVHPYPWTAAGSTVIPLLRDENSALHIALVHNIRRDKDKKVYRLPEGYMHPKGCPELSNGLPTVFQPNDEAEIKIAFHGVDHVEAYEQHAPIPVETADQDLFDTAIRELREEISLIVSKEQLTFLAQREENGRIHCVVHYFLADLNYDGKTFAEPPKLVSSDPNEIDEVRWIQPKDIAQIENKFFLLDGSEILPHYAEMIGHAVLASRCRELCVLAQKNISSPQELYDLLNPFIEGCNCEDYVPQQTMNYTSALGNDAELQHQQFIQLAKLYNERIRGKKFHEITPIKPEELGELIANGDKRQHIHSLGK